MTRPTQAQGPPAGVPEQPPAQHDDEQGNATAMGELPRPQRAELARELRSWAPGERRLARACADVELHGRGHVMRGEPHGEGPAGGS